MIIDVFRLIYVIDGTGVRVVGIVLLGCYLLLIIFENSYICDTYY